MPTPARARDEALFWLGQQDREHAGFLVLGTPDPGVRAEASRVMQAYEQAAAAGDVRALVEIARASQALKRAALALRREGWIGSLYPSLIEHMIEEVDHALATMSREVSLRDAACFWARERSGAAAVLGKLLDPSETALSAHAMRHSAVLRNLHAGCRRPSIWTEWTAPSKLVAAIADFDRFTASLLASNPASILDPLLAQHEMREGQRARQLLAESLQRPGAPPR